VRLGLVQDEVWAEIKSMNNFWMKLGVEPGADWELLQELEKKHVVYYPTARVNTVGYHAGQQSAAWLSQRFGIQCPTVIAAYEKGPLARALKYDFFLDDRPKNCIDIQAALPNCRVFLKDSSHNQDFDAGLNGFTRVKDFNEFANIILEGK
jgi:5'(3')-deoxyribonucleotidase